MSAQRVLLKTHTEEKPAFIDLETEPFGKETAQMYMMCALAESQNLPMQGESKESPDPFSVKVMKKRIEAYKLPISFTIAGWLATLAFTRDNPGRAVTLLIDALNFFPAGTEVTALKLGDLYPWGPYTEKAFENYVDNYLKTRLVPNSELY